MSRIKYECKNCGWTESLPELWGDLKPKRCMNKKCNTSFQKNPESLLVVLPEKSAQSHVTEKKSKKQNKIK
jgi:hypothetical protein